MNASREDRPLSPGDENAAKPAIAEPGNEAARPAKGFAQEVLFGLSLPERTLRSGVSLLGGALRESTRRLVPRAFQSSKTYSIMVQQMLDYLVEDVGRVAKPERPGDEGVAGDSFLARKAVGNFLEMTWLATLHVSPLTILAVVSDVAYGSQVYLHELAEELKREGVIAPDSTISNVDDLLGALSQASSTAATAFDTPPLSVEGLQETISQTRQAVRQLDPTRLIPQSEIQRIWHDMQELAAKEDVSLAEVSSTMALQTLDRVTSVGRGAISTVRVTTSLLDRHLVDHYRQAIDEIRQDGLYATLARSSAPYVEAVWLNYSPEQGTLTEDLLTGRLPQQVWQQVSSWWRRGGE